LWACRHPETQCLRRIRAFSQRLRRCEHSIRMVAGRHLGGLGLEDPAPSLDRCWIDVVICHANQGPAIPTQALPAGRDAPTGRIPTHATRIHGRTPLLGQHDHIARCQERSHGRLPHGGGARRSPMFDVRHGIPCRVEQRRSQFGRLALGDPSLLRPRDGCASTHLRQRQMQARRKLHRMERRRTRRATGSAGSAGCDGRHRCAGSSGCTRRQGRNRGDRSHRCSGRQRRNRGSWGNGSRRAGGRQGRHRRNGR
jgi:hypothetical protein